MLSLVANIARKCSGEPKIGKFDGTAHGDHAQSVPERRTQGRRRNSKFPLAVQKADHRDPAFGGRRRNFST